MTLLQERGGFMYKHSRTKHLDFKLFENLISAEDESNSLNNSQFLSFAEKTLHQVIANELTLKQKEVVLMYFFEGKNIVQIAKELNVNKSTVSRNLHAALKNLKKYMSYCKFR